MREILFRAKREDNGEWAYGYYVRLPDAAGSASMIHTPARNPDESNSSHFIRSSTIGQFTGLTDKNGVKIFDGDILQGDEYPYCSEGEYNYFAEVVWFDEGCCGAGLYTHKNPKSTVKGISHGNCEWLEDFDSDKWQVIGNIYDNPELIGGETDEQI
jgi:uncharacterized phage protein (TIGR01671 family)